MPANFGQLQDQIDEMYEEKSEDVKKMYSPQDFTEEIHKSVLRTLKKSGINPTKEAIQDVIIGIKQLSAYYDLTQEGAIEAISISAVGMIKDLKYSPVQNSSPIRTVAEVAILAKLADVLVNKDGTLNIGVVNSMIDNYSTLSHEGKMELLDCSRMMPTELLDRLCEAINKSFDKTDKIPEAKKPEYKQATELMKYFIGASKGEIKVDPETAKKLLIDNARGDSSGEVSKMFSDVWKYLKGKGIKDDEKILAALMGVASEVAKNKVGEGNCYVDGVEPAKEYDKSTLFSSFEIPLEDGSIYRYNDLMRDEEFKNITSGTINAKAINKFLDATGQYIQTEEVNIARANGDTERIGKILADIKKHRTQMERISAKSVSLDVDASKMEYGMSSAISMLDKDIDKKTIEAALKLFNGKMEEIFKDKDAVEELKSIDKIQFKGWLKKQKTELKGDKSIPEEVKTVYEKLLSQSFGKNLRSILKDDKSMSDYLEYISQPELAQMIKQGIEDRDKQKEGQETEQPKKENTPIQPQEAPVPIENAMMNTFMDLFGGPVNGNEISTVYLGGRESLINKEKEDILKVNSMENYIGKVDEGGPVTYDDIKDRFEKKDILHDLKTAEQLEYNEPPVEAVNELLVGPRGKKLVRNPEEMIQEEVNPMEEVAQDEPMAPDAGEAPKGPEEGVSAPEGPAEINEPETQGVEDAFETAPSENGDIGIDETVPEVEEPAEEVIQEEIAQDEPMAPDAGEAPKGPEEGISAPEEPAEINEPETQGVEDAFETAPSENGDIGIDETMPEVEEPAEEVMQEEITQEDLGKMAQEPEKTQEGPQLGETSGLEAPVPAVISDRQGQLKKLSENVPMRAFREMMDNIKQKMIELKDRITGKNKNPEDRENNDDDFTQ